jgi:amino acid transporter
MSAPGLDVKTKALLRWETTASNDTAEKNEINANADGENLRRTVGPFSATMLITGMVIGSGIFSTPSGILKTVGSVGMGLTIWVIGGIVSYFGVLAYLELGCMLPRSGGEKEYLDTEYRRPRALMPFIFCMSLIFLIRPGSCAADSIVVGDYILFSAQTTNEWAARGIGVAVITSICIIHSLSVRGGIAIQNVLTGVKVVTLLFICMTGIVAAAGGIPSVPKTGNFDNSFAGTSANGNAYASALFKVFFAYDGWNNANYILDELKNPIRTLKISALSGITLVTILYTVANIAYVVVVPKDDIINATTLVAAEFFHRVFGPVAGARVLPILVAISAYGSVMCMTFTAGRVIFEAAKEGYLPFADFFATVSRFETPMNAFIIHWVMTMALMLAPPPGEAYNFIIDLTGYPSWIFYGASVLGLIVLRYTAADLPRPFRSPQVFNGLFILTCAFLVILPFVPSQSSSQSDTTLPYWLYPTLGLIFIFASIGLWYWQIVVRKAMNRSPNAKQFMRKHPGVELGDMEEDVARKSVDMEAVERNRANV